MKKYDGYLIDLDGTMYRGEQPIPYAKQFIETLQKKQKRLLFVTNNSTRTEAQFVKKLKNFGIYVDESQVLTSAVATAQYIQSLKPEKGVLVIGESGIQEAIKNIDVKMNDVDPDYVVIGLDRAMNYEKLTKAAVAIQHGAKLIATNKDYRIPINDVFHPGNGAFTTALELAANTKAYTIGKPQKEMMTQALHILNVPKEKVIMVGDNYDTDILFGINDGVDTLHVQTGVTTLEDLKQVEQQPTYTVKQLNEWVVK